MDNLFEKRIPESEMDDGEKHGWREDGYPDTPKYKYGGAAVRLIYDRKQARKEKRSTERKEIKKKNRKHTREQKLF
mgnify:CR=1 FL=1